MPEKFCFVTVGATASFDALIRSVLQAPFLRTLAKQGFTNLLIQFGKEGKDLFCSLAIEAGKSGTYGLKIQGFDLTRNMMEVMRATKAEDGREEGVVLCHAGTGSVLAAMRFGVPVIVVPNPTLLDNHQVEFAEQMARMNYVVHGNIENLPSALEDSEKLRAKMHAMPPPREYRVPSGLEAVIDEEMGIEIAGHIE